MNQSLKISIFSLFFIVLCGLCLFISHHPLNPLDLGISADLQQFQIPFLLYVSIALAYIGSGWGTVLGLIGLIGYSWWHKFRYGLYSCVLGFFGTVFFTWGLKVLFHRPRPEITAWVKTYGSSFPSGHSAYAAMLAIMITIVFGYQFPKHKMRIALGAMAWVFLVGWSRVYIGAHYPTDVLAGWSVSICVMMILTFSLQKLGYGTDKIV